MNEQTITVEEQNAWQKTAERHCRNEMFYSDIIQQLGPLLGPEVYTSDDGSVQDSVLALKVVEVVSGLRARCSALEVALADFAEMARTSHNGHPGPRSCYGCALIEKHAAEGESRVPDSEVKNLGEGQ